MSRDRSTTHAEERGGSAAPHRVMGLGRSWQSRLSIRSIRPECFTWDETVIDDLVSLRIHKSRDVYDNEGRPSNDYCRVALPHISTSGLGTNFHPPYIEGLDDSPVSNAVDVHHGLRFDSPATLESSGKRRS